MRRRGIRGAEALNKDALSSQWGSGTSCQSRRHGCIIADTSHEHEDLLTVT